MTLNPNLQRAPTTQEFYELVLLLTGRIERIRFGTASPPERQKDLLGTFIAELTDISSDHSRAQRPELHDRAECEVFNSILTALGIKTVSLAFYRLILGNVDFAACDTFRVAVDRFRILAMLEYGNFRYAYKTLRDSSSEIIGSLLAKYFPDEEHIRDRLESLESRRPLVGLQTIPPKHRFALGYLASAQMQDVNQARHELNKLLSPVQEVITANDQDIYKVMKARKQQAAFRSLMSLVNVPEADALAGGPLFWGTYTTLADVLRELLCKLTEFPEKEIETARACGRHNMDVYLATGELDLYIATSMRDLHHFTSMAKFVDSLFREAPLADLNVRYFDPTQSYIDDRIQKGLVECLMVKRARATIYNAQESDTFGKDSEASISLALGKPVIVYVARFFQRLLAPEYAVIDRLRERDVSDFVQGLIDAQHLEARHRRELLRPGVTDEAIIKAWCEHHIQPIMRAQDADEIWRECQEHGYLPGELRSYEDDALREYALERIARHETRALTFSKSHPLGLQTAVNTGVANGVMVTRDVAVTAALTRAILLGNMQYDIACDEQDPNTVLRERKSGCPVRVVVANDILTTAFWDSYLRHRR